MSINVLTDRLWQELLDKADRTSPAEYPDHCLISKSELSEYLSAAQFSWGEERRHGIDIQDLREGGPDGGGLIGFWARGHHDLWKFAEAVNAYTSADAIYDRRYVNLSADTTSVRHEWWRTVPDATDPGSVLYHNAEPHSRGAFAVTVTTVVEDRERRQTQREIDQHNRGADRGFCEGLNWALRQLDRINHEVGAQLLAAYREVKKP
jgi:hypothetical protein